MSAAPQARAIRCGSFGGGWLVALTDAAAEVLTEYFGEPPADLAPICATGWIVEPAQSEEVAEAMKAAGITWEIIA